MQHEYACLDYLDHLWQCNRNKHDPILELARLKWVDQGLFISGLTAVLPIWEVSKHAYQWYMQP